MPSHSQSPRPRLCALEKGDNGYGFHLHGEKGKTGQFIRLVEPDSPAESSGLRAGDRLVFVNGDDVENESHQQVVTRIRATVGKLELIVVDPDTEELLKRHNLKCLKTHVTHGVPLSSEQEEDDEEEEEEDEEAVVEVRDAKVDEMVFREEETPEMETREEETPGQEERTPPVPERNVDNHVDTSEDTNGDTHKYTYQDIHEDEHKDITDITLEDNHLDPHEDPHEEAHEDQHGDTHEETHEDNHADKHADIHEDNHADTLEDIREDVREHVEKKLSVGSEQGVGTERRPRLCVIQRGSNGYGFNLHSERARPGQYIRAVDEDSPAERSGLQPKDRIVQVNNVPVEGKTHSQVVAAIKSGGPETRLLVVDVETDIFFKRCRVVPTSDHLTGPLPEPVINGGMEEKMNGRTAKEAERDSKLSVSPSPSNASSNTSLTTPPTSTPPEGLITEAIPALNLTLQQVKELSHQKRSNKRAPPMDWTKKNELFSNL